ncbi:MAG: ketoacyl-ACP synthase III [Candidatus Afipia apatlaquensis]|uniref:Ketoacyl-ACP synthase III n=1 Tax=Candidatus Afipia apatlaquensis TaxID=2712852 RepID=A0A7C9RGQ8_9BRAD|nr:ketoacyl-ACP synthase III [Candidatus Afipia apatlaquensis]
MRIKDVEVYHGKKVVPNEYYIEYFKKRDKDIEHLMKDIMGRNKRYMVDSEDENTLTMSIDVTKKVLEKTNLKGTDIDLLIFSSQLPEYVAPPSSTIIHNAIGGKHNAQCFDLNANCVGMVTAVEHTCKYMQISPKIKNALIVGCDFISFSADPENELSYGNYGDASCAIILERTTEDAGLIDSRYYVNNEECNNILFPGCGFSKMFKIKNKKDMFTIWKPFNGSIVIDPAVANMKEILSEQNISKDDVKLFCLTQFAYKNIELIQKKMDIPMEKCIYIGDEYGYTGTTSPFIALYAALQKGIIQRGDYIMFWAVGAGSLNAAMLFKY